MKKGTRTAMIVIFCGFLGCFTILNLFSPQRTFSDAENRVLAQFPEFSWKRFFFDDYTTDLEEWFTDQFIARDLWIGVKAAGERALGKIENQNVYFGREDWLIGQVDVVDRTQSAKNIAKINAFAEVFRENVETDLTLQNILWFAKAAFTGGLKPENVEFVTMPNTKSSSNSPSSHCTNIWYGLIEEILFKASSI